MTPTFAQPPYGVASLADRDSHKPARERHWRWTMHRVDDALITAKAAVTKLAEKHATADAVAPITDGSIRRAAEISEALRKATAALSDAENLHRLCKDSSGATEGALCRSVESAANRSWSEWKGVELI